MHLIHHKSRQQTKVTTSAAILSSNAIINRRPCPTRLPLTIRHHLPRRPPLRRTLCCFSASKSISATRARRQPLLRSLRGFSGCRNPSISLSRAHAVPVVSCFYSHHSTFIYYPFSTHSHQLSHHIVIVATNKKQGGQSQRKVSLYFSFLIFIIFPSRLANQ